MKVLGMENRCGMSKDNAAARGGVWEIVGRVGNDMKPALDTGDNLVIVLESELSGRIEREWCRSRMCTGGAALSDARADVSELSSNISDTSGDCASRSDGDDGMVVDKCHDALVSDSDCRVVCEVFNDLLPKCPPCPPSSKR